MKSGTCELPDNEDCELGYYPLNGCTEVPVDNCSYYNSSLNVCVGCNNDYRLDYEDPDVPTCIDGHPSIYENCDEKISGCSTSFFYYHLDPQLSILYSC